MDFSWLLLAPPPSWGCQPLGWRGRALLGFGRVGEDLGHGRRAKGAPGGRSGTGKGVEGGEGTVGLQGGFLAQRTA